MGIGADSAIGHLPPILLQNRDGAASPSS